jgi:splicing factor 3A subunit 1
MNMDIPEDITIPPPSIKSIIQKTCQYIQNNGEEFINKLRQQQKFTFLKENDPYNAYFQYVLDHFVEEEEEEEVVEKIAPLEFLIKELPVMTLKDLEIVKLTSEFVAKNGDDSMDQLKEKYVNEPLLFGFMEHGHKWYNLFQALVTQYRLVADEQYGVLGVIEMLERAKKRAQYEDNAKEEEELKAREEEEKGLKFASVDWMDFVIVETIQFEEVDMIAELAEPITIEELQLRSLDTKSKQLTAVKSDDSTKGMNIREFGTTRLRQQTPKERMIECPFTHKMITEKSFERHIQILLRDPKYKEEKLRYESKIQNSNLRPDEVAMNIKNLFKGSDKGEKRQKVLWDGYSSSMDYVKDHNKVSKEEVDEYKHKQREPVIGPKRR